jgi:hypothetical protein
MRPWFKTWNRGKRSRTSNRNTAIVISVSGSWSSSYRRGKLRIHLQEERGLKHITHVAFQQRCYLVLNNLCLPQQPLVNRESFQPRFWGSDPVSLGIAIRAHSLDEVIRIMTDVPALGLGYKVCQSAIASVAPHRFGRDGPSAKLLMASMFRCRAR